VELILVAAVADKNEKGDRLLFYISGMIAEFGTAIWCRMDV